MRRLLLALGVLACLAVATRTVTVRVEIMRAGYERARIEGEIREERELIRCLESEIATATCPGALMERARTLGVELVHPDPSRIVVAPPPAYAEDAPTLIVRR